MTPDAVIPAEAGIQPLDPRVRGDDHSAEEVA
jgi:hypothetical protein